ncbi:GNAT family N-acetyltransferase [Vibrio hannami]|uniref:GNAT family N-acetyltransferase n=1 Tax=Vibrio hannami TaxID=2717094 RepID=UPI00240FB4AA|nr:GNAT family N-acetyltransferase [Vibrio hannami]MDG3085183.1 GNAT family N-acetyltransferase [Vibrio hannami]
MEIVVELVKLSDTNDLLDFELENREWFEKHIPPRLSSFYSLTGVRVQIEQFLENYENQTMVPMLIKTLDGQICGRLNLSIDESESTVGTVGYRVGELYTRKGVATQAVKYLQKYVVENTEIRVLKAIALTTNIGSCRTLENNGFKSKRYIKDFTLLNGRHESAQEYVWAK